MGTKKEGFWKKINQRLSGLREEFKQDSVAANPQKPVDCCNPPVFNKKSQDLKDHA